MPDRELREEELRKFVEEHISGDIFHALEAFQKEKTKPTLHDLCILELVASSDAHREFIIQQGRTLNALKVRVEQLEKGRFKRLKRK
ncbi:MAG: hypothetical protein OEY47_01400 [Candidatus Bathyarchaeota archaeon]|nr:hypothetical protein [Candidatus Bathyarchaeota archaeon]